jgi:adenylosuccinate lyase
MPYKQNPMRSERMVALSRYVINLVGNCYETAASQWFERTLDDSANRRLVLPQAFLVTDGLLNLAINIASGLRVQESVIAQRLEQEMPFLQTEEILMAAVRHGGDRQALHERIRKHAEEVVRQVREKGGANDLLARIRKDPAFSRVPPKLMVRAKPEQLVGMAPEQVDRFVRKVIEPIRRKYRRSTRVKVAVNV